MIFGGLSRSSAAICSASVNPSTSGIAHRSAPAETADRAPRPACSIASAVARCRLPRPPSASSRGSRSGSRRLVALSSTTSARTIAGRTRRRAPSRRARGQVEPRHEVEPAAFARLALEPEPAAHHLDELRRDREAQPGAAVPACGRWRRPARTRRRSPTACPRECRCRCRAPCTAASPRPAVRCRDDDLDAHFAGVGELHGVADQIEQDLSQASRIADERPRARPARCGRTARGPSRRRAARTA